jgi:tetratricopeptide (TPR) repeat protein
MTAVRYDDCISSQKNAWRVNYGYDEIPFALGAAYYYKGMRAQTDSEKRELEDSALDWELKALEINPLAAQPYNIIAKIYIDRGEMERVTDLLAPATSYASFDAPMWNNLGYAYSRQDKWDEAVFCYTKALESDPAMQQARANLRIAQARVRSVSPEKTLEVDRQIKEHIEAGDRFRREQRLSEAAECYRAALGLDPDNYIANLYLGNIYYLQEDYTNARKYYQASLLSRPDNTGALKNLALTELKLGNRPRCIQLFEQVLKLDPKDEAVRKELDALRSKGL